MHDLLTGGPVQLAGSDNFVMLDLVGLAANSFSVEQDGAPSSKAGTAVTATDLRVVAGAPEGTVA